MEGLGEHTDVIIELLSTHAPRIVGVLVALLAAWIASGMLRRGVRAALEKARFDATLTRFFSNLSRWALLVAAVVGCLGVFGVDTTSFAALIGAAGLAVGLAFQGTLSNFAAGVMLLIFRPFKVHDVIQVSGTTGAVVEIELFTTELVTADNVKIIMPNSSIFGSEIKNFTHNPHRRVDVSVGTDYGADLDQTRATLEKALADVPGALSEPAPEVFLKGLGGSSVDWQLRVFCEPSKYWDVWQATIRAGKYALDGAGIGIPFPQVDVHLDEEVVRAVANAS